MLRDLAFVAIAALMFVAGLRARPGALAAVLRDRSLIARALAVNVIIVPLFGLAVVRTFALALPAAVGIMLMALAPGVPLDELAAGRKKGGSDALAVTLSFVMPAVSIVSVPLWLAVLAPAVGGALDIGRYVALALAFQLVPLLAGLEIRRRNERLASSLIRPVLAVAYVALLALVVTLLVHEASAIGALLGTRTFAAILLLCVLNLAAGWFAGGPDVRNRDTLGIATVLRNIGLAAMMATNFFGGAAVLAVVLGYLIVQAVVGTVAARFFVRHEAARPTAPPPAG